MRICFRAFNESVNNVVAYHAYRMGYYSAIMIYANVFLDVGDKAQILF